MRIYPKPAIKTE